MTYSQRIENIIANISTTLVDFSGPRNRASAPTQVSSEFLTNKEQGDWAEATLLNAVNENSENYVAVKYGRDDDIIAGEDGFKEFYEAYQNELDEIGKRPDILIFEKKDFPFDVLNISNFSNEVLDEIVPKAKCGIEVRSSAFLIDKYESYMNDKQNRLVCEALALRKQILTNYGILLKEKEEELYKIIQSVSSENLHVISFKAPVWRATSELSELSLLLRNLYKIISEINKRTYLSITPKVEDLKVVYNWIRKYNVPHFYVQVFFDKAYGISFEKILTLIGNPALEGKKYFIEADIKNQNKTTIKIKAKEEDNILENVCIPEHYSEMKELGRGRLLFFVKFKDSLSVLSRDAFKKLFGFEL